MGMVPPPLIPSERTSMGYQPLPQPKRTKVQPKQDHPATFAHSLLPQCDCGEIAEQGKEHRCEERYPLPAIDIRLISEDSR